MRLSIEVAIYYVNHIDIVLNSIVEGEDPMS